jgi:hypothetical protein
MAYASGAQPCDGAMLPSCAATRCFATVIQSHTGVVRYLYGDGENATCEDFPAPIRWPAYPAEHEHQTGTAPYGCPGLPASASADRTCRITNQSLSFNEQRSGGGALMLPARD